MSTNEEWSGVSRQPRVPVVVPGLKYPKAVVTASKKCDEVYSIWAEAETAWMEAEQEVSEAKALDARLFAESVLNGTEDPGEVHTPVAERKLKAAEIILMARLRDANRAGAELSDVMKEHQREILLSAVEMAEEGLRRQEEMMMEASKLAHEAIEVRNKSLIGIREVSTYTRGVYQFDPSFPSSSQIVLPDVSENRIKKICEDLRQLVERGVLFAEESVEILEPTA